ncbi:MAG: tetratricopeptide repeat protein [Bacteroidetes bacterium]|nr:tetratricopeptide repeat protein [Bacteroidota bacterium]
MKRYFTLIASGALLFLGVCTSSCSQGDNKDMQRISSELSVPKLLPREQQTGTDAEYALVKGTYDKAIEALKNNPEDLKQFINLASVYITEGRVTGNTGYYSNASLNVLDKVIKEESGDKDIQFEALSLKSAVLLNMHQFKDALKVAKEGEAMNNSNSGIYGALVDANVEMGNYAEAVKDCDKMLSIRPDLRSYSRASYLRQIYGDNSGAIAAMKMAVLAGGPGDENTEWARVTLGDLFLNTGKADSAAMAYNIALAYRPKYAYALIGLAKVQKVYKNYDSAIALTRQAIKIISQPAFVGMLADLYELKGDNTKAAEVRNDIVKLMEDNEQDQAKQPTKHNANRELAIAYMDAKQSDKALQYALKDLEMRPDNIDANELAAWIYYQRGDYANAKIHADKTLKTNTKNAMTLYKDGMIYAAAGDAAKGNELMQEARMISPYIDQRILLAAK